MLNPFLIHLTLNAWIRIVLVSVGLAGVGASVELAMGASLASIPGQLPGWWGLFFPLSLAIALADLWAQHVSTGQWTGAISIGVSRIQLTLALALPALLATGVAVGWQATASHETWAMIRGDHRALLSPDHALDAHARACVQDVALCARVDALSYTPSANQLRTLTWEQLENLDGGVVERLRRVVEPFLGLVLAAGSITLLRRWRRKRDSESPLRPEALLLTVVLGALLYAMWNLLLMLA